MTLKTLSKYLLIALIAMVILASWPAYLLCGEIRKASSEDPLVWEQDIRALELCSQAHGLR